MGGLAGVRQRGGRWRRITLVRMASLIEILPAHASAKVCVAMLVVIGLPLFVFLMVKSKVVCTFDAFDRPELIEVRAPHPGLLGHSAPRLFSCAVSSSVSSTRLRASAAFRPVMPS